MSPRARRPPVLAFSGASGSGKTTLLVKLLPALAARGLAVAALKGSGHRHAFDRPGKDSARLRAAGARAVALASPHEVAFFGPPVQSVGALLRLLPPVDLVVAEGFRRAALPRVEVHRQAIDAAFLCATDRRVIAVVSDAPPPRPVPWFRAGEVEALADLVAAFARAGGRTRRRALAAHTQRDHPSARAGDHEGETSMAMSTKRRSGSRARGSAARSRSGKGRSAPRSGSARAKSRSGRRTTRS
ncbi:MAG TPA: molybdopterin-guanine dinucleotide biosynthesis protein B, partial [Anaeromyxobacteraceae bacterium]|nr:molybdopterin-guanine dinucleotide biosynthesis protein B [Anaeromyxobacteraceae bacterium]